MSALKQEKSFITAAAVTASKDWQIDRVRSSASHISGLTVQWQNVKQGGLKVPALDIGGLQKLNGTPWSQQINTLIDEAITLLEA